MPKYLVLKPHMLGRGESCSKGDVIELDKKEGDHRIAIGFVELYVPEPATVPAGAPDDEDNRAGKKK